MTEGKDPLKTIQEALNIPLEAIEPIPFDDAAITCYLAERYKRPTLKDEIQKNKT